MIKFKQILHESASQAKKNFVNSGKIDNNLFGYFLKEDSSESKKYVEKMCEFYYENKNKVAVENILAYDIKLFTGMFDFLCKHNIIKNKDINSYKNFEDFKNICLDGKKIFDNKSDVNTKQHDVEKIYEDDNFLIISPKTYEASCIYGRGTKWCISGIGDGKRYWKEHVEQTHAKFYFIFNKKLTKDNVFYKIAIEKFNDGQIIGFDSMDNQIKPLFFIFKNLGVPDIFNYYKKYDRYKK